MDSLPPPLRALVRNPDPQKVFIYPSGGKKNPSCLFIFGSNKGTWLAPRYRKFLEGKKETRLDDRTAGWDRSSAGFRTDEQWAQLFGVAATTVARYRRDIEKLIVEMDVNPDTAIFETLEEKKCRWIRIREHVVFVPSKLVNNRVKRRKLRRRRAKATKR